MSLPVCWLEEQKKGGALRCTACDSRKANHWQRPRVLRPLGFNTQGLGYRYSCLMAYTVFARNRSGSRLRACKCSRESNLANFYLMPSCDELRREQKVFLLPAYRAVSSQLQLEFAQLPMTWRIMATMNCMRCTLILGSCSKLLHLLHV